MIKLLLLLLVVVVVAIHHYYYLKPDGTAFLCNTRGLILTFSKQTRADVCTQRVFRVKEKGVFTPTVIGWEPQPAYCTFRSYSRE